MAVFDQSAQKIVVRVVYDGPAMAGKTTNIEQLTTFFTPRRRTEMLRSDESSAKRTLYFDWMQLDSGLVHGHELRCQLLTVPGQAVLFRRRSLLITKADAIVFVLEATLKGLEEAVATWQSLNKVLEANDLVDLPIVIQANKQDVDRVVTKEDVRAHLDVPERVRITTAEAHNGLGVRETLVLALRGAANQVQNRILAGGIDSMAGTYEDAKQLRDLIEVDENEAGASPLEVVLQRTTLTRGNRPAIQANDTTPDRSAPSSEADVESSPTPRTSPSAPASNRDTPAPESELRPQIASVAAADPSSATDAPETVESVSDKDRSETSALPPFPDPNVMPGLVWPAAAGREVLRRVPWSDAQLREDLNGSRGTEDGSGRNDSYVFEAGLWCLKTSDRRRYATLERARSALLRLARDKTQLESLLAPQTALAVRIDASGMWLWTIAPWLETLRSQMTYAVDKGDEERLADALKIFVDATVASLRLSLDAGLVLDIHPSNFGIVGERCYYIDDDITLGRRPASIGHAILRRADEYHEHPDAIAAYGEYFEERIEELTPEEVRVLGIKDALGEAFARTDVAQGLRTRLIRSLGAPALEASATK